ncbi:hypothetical protein [Allopontixanthobacter sp.]|uniref:hypothetical protein n=1 Tax=Allopontixanthobacter sp. TaxID=2906452 RepID=UPI002ABBFDEF|nr:hypothetical protein [Allopontixanthobacter sp.]MDZ4308241.1 hypothetical protein [Allopontixanthobacter sp.]
MSWATAIVLIVLISAIAGVMRSRSRIDRRGGHETPDQVTSPERERELQREVTELRERIKVLERIATDTNSSEARETKAIAEQIERLREK